VTTVQPAKESKNNVQLNNQKKIKQISSSLQSIDNNEIFTLQIKGRKNYEILKKLNDALELQTAFLTKKFINSNNNNEPSVGLKRKISVIPTNSLEK